MQCLPKKQGLILSILRLVSREGGCYSNIYAIFVNPWRWS